VAAVPGHRDPQSVSNPEQKLTDINGVIMSTETQTHQGARSHQRRHVEARSHESVASSSLIYTYRVGSFGGRAQTIRTSHRIGSFADVDRGNGHGAGNTSR
jgi:hypothetical protein